jgi:outer membrane murein-binding lipoprotein Lpp
MGEKKGMVWKAATVICAVLLAGAIVAVVLLVVNQGNKVDKNASEEQVSDLENKVEELEGEIGRLEGELNQALAALASQGSNNSGNSMSQSKPSDRDQLEALGESVAGNNFHVGEIVIDGDWARLGIAANDPTKYQGELCYCRKVDGQWVIVESGTGLQYGDIPGAPASIFP